MRYTLASLAIFGAVAIASPQGVTSAVAPQASVPAGCSTSYSGSFEIETVNATTASSKRDLEKRQTVQPAILMLSNGILTDEKGRTGYIAGDNYQFQFDSPPQAGAVYTAGWSVCANGTLAIGGTTLFKQCLKETSYDLYYKNDAAQCSPVYIQVIPVSAGQTAASQLSDGQPQATPVTQLSDGQPQASTAAVATQKSDGQVQVTSAKAPATQKSDGQIQVPTMVATQKTDGQVQVPTAKPVASQLSDGQIQVTTARASLASTSRPLAAYSGAAVANNYRGEALGLAAGVFAAALL